MNWKNKWIICHAWYCKKKDANDTINARMFRNELNNASRFGEVIKKRNDPDCLNGFQRNWFYIRTFES